MNALSKHLRNQRLNKILEILQKGRMISVHDTASKLGCSTRTIHRALQQLKKEGHQFKYNITYRKFIYIQTDHNGQHDKGEAENLTE
jgi:DeoR/GlpR family transcriptional regulator of sugar metabolism